MSNDSCDHLCRWTLVHIRLPARERSHALAIRPGLLARGPDDLAYRMLSAARCATIQRMIEYAVDITAESLITADKQET